ncbi:DNA translocase FtsK [Pseudalkalibacillus sp. NRS-1564]|uniref:DNA translocase FtsK n=1 Tax=Pseudalkalibacillus sp. NRS-1564 TaxID=3233900 RepID=UPI003D2D4E15
MDNNWIKKAWNKLFDLDEEEEPQRKETDVKETKSLKDRPDRKHSIGRMENANRKNEARIVHQYPREGNFRFPLIPDHSNNQKNKEGRKEVQRHQSEQIPTKKPKAENRNQSITSPKKDGPSSKTTRDGLSENNGSVTNKKFSGVNFKPSQIPSPIYGFSKRPVTEKMEEEVKKSHPNNRYTSLDKSDVIEKLIQEPEPYSLSEGNGILTDSDQVTQGVDQQETEAVSVKEETTSKAIVNEEEREDNREVFISDKNNFGVKSDASLPLETEKESEQSSEADLEISQPEKQWEQIETLTEDVTLEETNDLQKNEMLEEENEEKSEWTADYEVTDDMEEDFIISDEDFIVEHQNEEQTAIEESPEPEPEPEPEPSNQLEVEQQFQREQIEESIEESSQHLEHKEKNVQEQSGRDSARPKPQVPYNVMMLANDRRHLTKKPGSGAEYKLPPISLLDIPPRNEGNDEQWLEEQRELLELTLSNFNVQAKVVGATMGPTVTRFEVQPSPGVKVNKITNLSDDIKLSLAARDIRMEAPIPGKNAIGIEVPNPTSKPVFIREIVRSGAFQSEGSLLNAALGFDIAGEAKITDIQKMPHGLIAGATGSGKSVCINSILVSLLLKANPNDVKMMLIDPKMVELAPYNGLPHLVTPVINDVKEATTALKWAVDEMEERYEKFAAAGVRDIKRYNERAINHGEPQHKLPYIVIVIDELADLMMVSPQDVEDAICRIAQKARACGIHLLVATQRPSVDVITGLIKANIPTRIAFSVSSQIDSRTILDTSGAEKLLGKGDMLCLENGSSKPVRLQGNFVSDEEIERVTSYVRKQRKPNYLIKKEDLMKKQQYDDQEDELFEEACMWALEQGQASSSALQRRFRIGFNRAARLIEMMEERGLVSEAMGSKPRSILMTKADFEETFLKDMHV